MTITCVITDDEPYACKGLQGYIERVDFLQLVGVCEDALQLNTFLKSQHTDLLFLDVEMPYLTGIEFLQSTPSAPQVILTTAYERYALQGFELEILDYLLKPVSFERFLKSANKAYDYFSLIRKVGSSEGQYFFVKTDSRLEKIQVADILFIEAMENYVGIYTTTAKTITLSTLKALSSMLSPEKFIQPHKSYLVAIDKIQSIEGNMLHVDRYQIPISKYLKEEVMQRVLHNKMLRK